MSHHVTDQVVGGAEEVFLDRRILELNYWRSVR